MVLLGWVLAALGVHAAASGWRQLVRLQEHLQADWWKAVAALVSLERAGRAVLRRAAATRRITVLASAVCLAVVLGGAA